MRLTLERLRFIEHSSKAKKSFEIKEFITAADRDFYRAMDDDFNTPEAVAALFKLITPLQNKLWLLSGAQAKELSRFLLKKLELLGIAFITSPAPLKARTLLKQREKLRGNQQFIQADALKKRIERLGYRVDDTPWGPLILRA